MEKPLTYTLKTCHMTGIREILVGAGFSGGMERDEEEGALDQYFHSIVKESLFSPYPSCIMAVKVKSAASQTLGYCHKSVFLRY